MAPYIAPQGYSSKLSLMETEIAIKKVKDLFEVYLAKALNLTRVSAPLFVDPATGLNDNLNGIEMPVSFNIKDMGLRAEIVQSLAKWKRMALHRYGFAPNTGLYTDMNAIRPDETMDEMHSIYVDQWDWEKVITRETRNLDNLKSTVRAIYAALRQTALDLQKDYPSLMLSLPQDITFVTTQELEDTYPDKTPFERECAFVEKCGAAFIVSIGSKLKSGTIHDGRAPDYDDWSLNGDIVLWNPIMGRAFEISSMGIRVDAAAMKSQLEERGCIDRATLPFHQGVLTGTLPLTMGGGIGQSRLCMFILNKIHVGEVQTSIWPQDMVEVCKKAGIVLL